jgi:predicted aconitase with swiveling domain
MCQCSDNREVEDKKVIRGRVINGGNVKGQAIVLSIPFSFIGDFDPLTGILQKGHPMEGESIAGKILVCPGGRGGTVAPYIAYEAMKRKVAPLAILCQAAEPIIALSAITIGIPFLDNFDADIVKEIKTGDYVEIDGDKGTVTVG